MNAGASPANGRWRRPLAAVLACTVIGACVAAGVASGDRSGGVPRAAAAPSAPERASSGHRRTHGASTDRPGTRTVREAASAERRRGGTVGHRRGARPVAPAATETAADELLRSVRRLEPALRRAPSGFAGDWERLYGRIFAVFDATGVPESQPGGIGYALPPTAFDRLVGSLSQHEIDELYSTVSERLPDWRQLSLLETQLETDATALPAVGSSGGSAPSAASSAVSDQAGSAVAGAADGSSQAAPAAGDGVTADVAGPDQTLTVGVASSPFPPTPPTPVVSTPPEPFQPSAPVGPAPGILACPAPAPGADYGDAAIFAAQSLGDTLAAVATYTPDTSIFEVFSNGLVTVDAVTPNVYRAVLAATALAAQETAAGLEYQRLAWLNCISANWVTYLANVDNTTVNTYGLLTQVEGTLDSLQSSVDTVGEQVGTVQQTIDDELQLGVEQALAAPVGSAPNAAYELPASLGGELNSTPVGVQSVVTDAISAAREAGLPVNQVAVRSLAAANAALAAGSWSAAYADYATAYQQAAQ